MRRLHTLLAAIPLLAALCLLMVPSAAAPAGRIAIAGPASGTHLRLTMEGSRILVDGHLAGTTQAGCQLSGSREAICPLSGVNGIEIETGPSGDFVEVLDRLPFPLTVHLGGGSDKFIGNGEPDTCYSEGARRNRCIGEGGDDVCITGSDNSDCVGGPGDDYCQTSGGSDGCWGGPGEDYCSMGAGEDGCHGDAGNDRLYGGPDPDHLYGGPGVDFCDGGPGRGQSHDCEAGPRH